MRIDFFASNKAESIQLTSAVPPAGKLGDIRAKITFPTGLLTTYSNGDWEFLDTTGVINVKSYGAVGDGVTDDTAEIQNAFNEAGLKTVFFPNGNYLVSTTLTIPSNTTVIFANNAWLIPTAALADLNVIENSDMVGGNTNIVIRRLKIDGTNIVAATVASYAILFQNVTDFQIDGCRFENLPVSAIGAPVSTRGRILNNVFVNLGTVNLVLAGVNTGNAFTGTGAVDIVFANNQVDTVWGTFFFSGPTMLGVITSDIIVANNQFKTAYENGIRIDSLNPNYSQNIIFSQNTIQDVDGDAIRASAVRMSIVGNVITSTAALVPVRAPRGIMIGEGSEIAILGNIIQDTAGVLTSGIRVDADGDNIDNVIIDGNYTDGCDYSVQISRNAAETLYKYVLSNNIFLNALTYYGVRISDVVDLTINNNIVSGANRAGIYVDAITRLNIESNIVKNSQNAAGATGGIALLNCDEGLIVGNNSYDDQGVKTQQYGLNFNGGNTNIYVIGNNLAGNSVNGIRNVAQADRLFGNRGWLTENNGTGTVPNGSTFIDVAHGLAQTPAIQDISVTPTNDLGLASLFWISNVGAVNFRINVDINPGPATATFVWKAAIE